MPRRPARTSRILTASRDLVEDVVAANLILFDHDILDAFGHVSARHDKDKGKFVMSRYVAPGIVTKADIREFALDSEATPDRGEQHYSERYIHGEIYKARPDVMAVIHSHAPPLIPFGATAVPLRPLYHMSSHVGLGVPVFEIRRFNNDGQMLIRSPGLGRALAGVLADKPMVLMRGHGATVVASSLSLAVYRAIYAALNARMQMEAMRLGDVTYLSPEEVETCIAGVEFDEPARLVAVEETGERQARMNSLVETYRGGVVIQECDAFGHLNIAYYVERFADAADELMQILVLGTRWRTLGIATRYLAELRAGDPLAIASGVIAIDAASLRIGHVASNGMGGGATTIAEQVLALDAPDGEAWVALRAALPAARVEWAELPFEPVSLPERKGPVATGLSRVKTGEADAHGELSLFGFFDRFSTANLINMNAAGMTSTYMRAEHRGFATFETRLELFGPRPRLGDSVSLSSGMLDLGKSSVKILHEMRLARGGRRVARFYQAGVHFDLDSRRSAPLPELLRTGLRKLMIES